MLKDAIEYVDKHILRIKSNYPEEDNNVLEAALIYQFLYEFYMMKNITIKEILEKHPYIGLTGPGKNSTSTSCNTLRIHSIFHDSFGRFYVDHQTGGGYTYAWWNVPFWMKKKSIWWAGYWNDILSI